MCVLVQRHCVLILECLCYTYPRICSFVVITIHIHDLSSALYEELIRIRESTKSKQHNGHKEKYKRTSNDKKITRWVEKDCLPPLFNNGRSFVFRVMFCRLSFAHFCLAIVVSFFDLRRPNAPLVS